MISHKGKFIFIPVRRAAGTTISKTLEKYCNDKLNEEIDDFKKNLFNRGILSSTKFGETVFGDWYKDIEKYKDYFIFTIARNPWDRLISGYFYSQLGYKYLGRECSSLEEFLDNLPTRESNYTWWFHITRTLSEMLIDKDGNYIADFTIRFENLQADFSKVCEKLKFENIKLPLLNKTKHKHYSTYYNEKTRKIVAEKFSKDIEIFNYTFETNKSFNIKSIFGRSLGH